MKTKNVGIAVQGLFVQKHLKADSCLPKKVVFIGFSKLPFKSDEKWYLFHFKIHFPSWDVGIFVLTFWLCRKQLNQKAKAKFHNLWRHRPGNKWLQYIYCPISQEVNAIRHYFSWKIIRKMWWRSLCQTVLKIQNWAYLWINSLQCYKVCFYSMSKSRSSKID